MNLIEFADMLLDDVRDFTVTLRLHDARCEYSRRGQSGHAELVDNKISDQLALLGGEGIGEVSWSEDIGSELDLKDILNPKCSKTRPA